MKRASYSYIAMLSLISITVGTGMVLASSYTSAESTSSSATASVTVGSACSLTSTVDTAHTATISPGTYYDGDNNEGIGKTTIKITCNDVEGFALYAVGYTNDTYGTTTLNGANTGQTIATGTAQNGNTSNWAMKLSTTSTPTPAYPIEIANGTNLPDNFTNYHAVPSTYTKVAYRDSGTDTGDNATGSTLTTTYAAYIAGTQPADTYSGKVKYTMVHPASEVPIQPQPSTAGCINYFANASNAIGTMGCQPASDENTITLLASNFSRVGYGFAGWSDQFDYATNVNAHFYGPNEAITVPSGTTANGLSLYAVWVKSAGSLQDSTKVAELCGTVAGSLTQSGPNVTRTLSSVSALTDQRDNETYAIAKLADGNCWMIENLRLESEYTVGNNQTNPSVTNASLSQGYNSSFIGLANPESANFTNSTTANSLYSTDGSTSAPAITGSYTGYRFPRYNNLNTPTNSSDRPQNPTSNSFATNNTTVGMYSYGNYYTWHAALANTTYYNGPTATDTDGKTSETVGTSICPSGWKLPYGRNTGNGAISGGFSYLDTQLGGTGGSQYTTDSNRWRSYPNNFIYSGYFSGSRADYRGSRGNYWSSSVDSFAYAYYLYFYSNSVIPGTDNYGGYKDSGFSARCLVGS